MLILAEYFRLLMTDASAGLFFIASEKPKETATTVLEDILTLLDDDDSVFTLYVVEMGKTWDAATVQEDAVRELESHLPRE